MGELDKAAPEAGAGRLGAHDDVDQFLVGLAHELRHHEGDLVVLGGQGVDEKLDDPG